MKNKKKYLVIAGVMALMAANAHAKTEGNYVFLNLTDVNLKTNSTRGTYLYNTAIKDVIFGYRYVFNFNKFLVAPELSYGAGISNTLQESYNVKLNLGYDLTDNFALYGVAGWNSNNGLGKRESATYGLLTTYQLDENFGLNASVDFRDQGSVKSEFVSFGITFNF